MLTSRQASARWQRVGVALQINRPASAAQRRRPVQRVVFGRGWEDREVLGPSPVDAGAQTNNIARAPQLGGRERELAAGAADRRKGANEPTRRRGEWIVARGRTSTGPSERLTSVGAVEAAGGARRCPVVPGGGALDTLCPKAAHSLWNRPANTPTCFTTVPDGC